MRQRRAPPVDLRHLLRRAAEQRAVERLERLHLVLVRRDVVGHGDHGNPGRPQLRLGAQAEQGQVAAPGGAGQRDPGGVRDALLDELRAHGGEILELGQARPAGEGVPPLASVAGRAAVVHLDGRAAQVDVRGAVACEGVTVVPGGAAVHQEDGGVGPRSSRSGEQRMHRAARAGGFEILHGHRAGSPRAGRRQHDVALGRAHHGRLGGAGPGVLDGAVRAGGRAGDGARRRRQRLERAGREVEPVQGRAGAVLGVHEQGGAVLVPVGRQVAGQCGEVRIDPGAGRRVPQKRQWPAGALVQRQQPVVAGHRGEAQDGQPQPFAVPQIGHDVAGDGEHPQCLVPTVAVLAVLQDDQALVAREPGDVGVLLVAVEHPGPVVVDEPGGRPAVVGAAGHRQGPTDLEPSGIGGWHSRERLVVGTTGPRLASPDPELVAVAVVEPPHRLAIRRKRPVGRAVGAVGHLPRAARGPVPRVELEGAGGIADVEAPVCGVAGPLGQRDAGRADALLPHRNVVAGHGFGHLARLRAEQTGRPGQQQKGRPWWERPSASGGLLVGVTGFEPATSASRTQRATKLRHTPVVVPLRVTAYRPVGRGRGRRTSPA